MRGRRDCRTAVEASFTVEAVFVIPFVTILTVLMIDMVLYLRDVSVANGLATRIAEETRALVLNDEDPELGKIRYERKFERSIFARWFQGTDDADAAEMTKRLRTLVKGRFWIADASEATVTVSGGVATVRIRLQGDSGVAMLGSLATKQWFSDVIVRKCSCSDPRRQTRIYAAIMDTGSQIAGIKTIFEKLSEVVNRLR
ncbi:MAG: hypothetical protein J5645_08405 [Lachnospiraceae bacterium]|nr:hypothetical protein [Lachnospiraceae bacterium]